MRDIKGSTSEEIRMIRAIQRSVGALDNGYIGNQTLSDIAAKLGADCWPLNVELYGQPCIVARDIEPVNMSGPLPKNAISGSSVQHPRARRQGRARHELPLPNARERALQNHERRGAHCPRLLGGGAGRRRVGGRWAWPARPL